MTLVNITPSGGDDTAALQAVIKSGNEVVATGNFQVSGQIKFPSNVKFTLNGTMQGANQNMIVNDGNASNIIMEGGTYRGNGGTTNRLIEFANTTNSQFSNMIIENTGHTFGLTMGCSGNVCDHLTAKNSLNGLADRGSSNTWNDCVCDSMQSDFFIIKCKDSTFNRCIVTAPKVMGAAGFGFYARIDGSNNVGAEISGNKFFDCQAINVGHAGFSLNCPSNGNGAHIHDNFIQAVCTGNANGGLSFVNTSPGGTNEKNTFDVICHDNPGGGVVIHSNCNNNSGNVITYSNGSPGDVKIDSSGTGNIINAYEPSDKPKPSISGSKINEIPFACSSIPSNPPFCVSRYCGTIPSNLSVSLQINPSSISVNQNTVITATVTGGKGPYSYQWSGLPNPCTGSNTNMISCAPNIKGTFSINVNVTDSSTPQNTASATSTLTVDGIQPSTTKFKIHKDKTKITVSVSKTGITADEACTQVCDWLKTFP